jgi:hypothetical protein
MERDAGKSKTIPQPTTEITELQRTIGNRALGSMIGNLGSNKPSMTIQTKLKVGPIGDAYEQEADQVGKMVADQISSADSSPQQAVQRESEGGELEEEELQMKPAVESIQRESEGGELEEEELQMKPAAESIQRESEGGELEEEELQMKPAAESIQRESEGGELEEEELQMKPAAESIQRESEGGELEEEELQMKPAADGSFEADASIEQQIKEKQGSGSKMDNQIQAKMESAFGTSFNDVNIHSDTKSDELTQSVGAVAFATGNDIFFRQGEYNPGNREGQELLGHELTHVVQQRGGQTPAPS